MLRRRDIMNARGWFLLIFPVVLTVVLIILRSYLITDTPPTYASSTQQIHLFQIKNALNKPLNILATTLPQFAVDLTDKKFSNLWTAFAFDRESAVQTKMTNASEDEIKTTLSFDDSKKQVIVTPQSSGNLKPGLYHLTVTVKTYTGKDITITQDFTWGVMAINTSKAIYLPGQTIKIGMGVLDNKGNTKCSAHGDITYQTAKVWLKIISPSGKETDLSTDNGTIIGSKDCASTSVTNNSDFQAETKAQEIGKYTIHMTAQNINGTRSIDDYFTVSPTPPAFDIMRTSYPTRIYPYGHYPVEITIVANQDYIGNVTDTVPANFQISNISDYGYIHPNGASQQIIWQVKWYKGQTYKLTYNIKFPMVSPEFYIVGPFTVSQYSEGREWQIASDAISFVQSTSNVVNSGTSVSATFSSAVTINDLEVVICSETGSSTINTPARGTGRSWTNTANLSVTSSPFIHMYYKRANGTEPTTITCSFNSSSGVKAIQIFEYSGIATSGQLDGHGKLSGSTACNSNPFGATVSLTATNGNELVLSSHVATGTRTVNSHTAGFTQEFAFNGSTGTFTSADQIVTDPGTYTDTATFSGNATRCSAVIASFITPVTLTQNGYQFFENIDNINPATPFGNQNDDLTLPAPHAPFRLRFLIDIDGNQTVAIGGIDFILMYAPQPLSGDCSTLTDDDWNPITTSTPIAWNTNPSSGGSGIDISSSGNDPIDTSPHTYTTVDEDYYEDNTNDISNLQNSLSNNRAGLWDVSLIDNTSDIQSTTYCLEVVNGDGSGGIAGDLDSYLHYPKITTFYNEVNIFGGTTIKGGTTIN